MKVFGETITLEKSWTTIQSLGRIAIKSKEESFNCIIYDPEGDVISSWEEWQCRELEIGCPCSYDSQPILYLRGYCPDTYIQNQRYTPKQLPTDPTDIILVGMLYAQIRHNSSRGMWILRDFYDSNTDAHGETDASRESYALGKHIWTIKGDNIKCSKGQDSYDIEMKLTGCKDDEFTCDNGHCVKMEQRCNQLTDCRDESDETGCNILDLKQGYKKRVPPITREGLSGKSVPVRVSLALLKVVAIEEEDHSIELQFQITLEWKENRARFHNLKKETYMNALSVEDINRIWLPLVIFTNTDQLETTRLGENWEWTTRVVVKREGQFERSGFDVLDEIEIFG